ncbi:MAG: restriction endonuclease-like protein [Paludibacteraceae bacterium]|nr:restriction endonuclease-like protein [Paludibacteraceae bacterium]
MDVLIFVCDEYKLTVSTPDVSYSWERFFRRVGNEAFSYCDYDSTDEGKLSIFKPDTKKFIDLNEVPQTHWSSLWPVLFETCEFQFGVEFFHLKDAKNKLKQPKVLHQLKEVGSAFRFYPNGDHSGVLVGTINFLNSPGKFSFQFEFESEDGTHTTGIELYVASPKLDTKNDLNKITALINQEYENYVFEYLTLTFSSLKLKRSDKDNKVIWLSIFKKVINDYFKNVRYIMSRPNNKPVRNNIYRKADKVRHWSHLEIEKYKRYGKDADTYFYHDEVIEKTINTRENRFVKYSLRVLGKKYSDVMHFFLSRYSDMADEERDLLKHYNAEFKRLASDQFFRHVGEFEGMRQESAILQQRTGYIHIYRSWLMLKCSLDLEAGRTDIGLKKIWELYEIWCFLVMKRLIAKVLNIDLLEQENLPEQDRLVIENKSEMLTTMTQKDINHTISFVNERNGDIVNLEYQHTYNRKSKDEMKTTTTEQRPDILLTIKKTNGFVLSYLYDAKYRVQDDVKDGDLDDGENIDMADYPLPDAINQMHRYRDAIYYSLPSNERPSGKEVIGGYILFPGRAEGDKVRERYFYKSIDKVNIGAFPLLPSVSENSDNVIQCPLLEEHLKSIILDDTIYGHIKESVPQKGLQYQPNEGIANLDALVMVGYASSVACMKWIMNMDKGWYNIPTDKMADKRILESSFILMIANDTKEASPIYRIVKSRVAVWTKQDLIDNGYPSTPSKDAYFMIGIEKLDKRYEDISKLSFNVSKLNLQSGFAFKSVKELVELDI